MLTDVGTIILSVRYENCYQFKNNFAVICIAVYGLSMTWDRTRAYLRPSKAKARKPYEKKNSERNSVGPGNPKRL